jgi:hypothetical protein
MANTMTLISSVTVGSGGSSTITFSSIPSTYTDLYLVSSTRIASTATTAFLAQFNSDTTIGNYSIRYLEGNGASASSSTLTPSVAGIWAGNVTLSTDTANTFANSSLYIPNYTSSNQKSTSTDAVSENNATTTYADLVACKWSGTSAITQIDLKLTGSASFVQYSTAYLYGIKNS